MTVSRKPKLLNAGHADNFQTPASALDPLIPYLKNWNIWEPAAGKGNLVKGLHERGFRVAGTDLNEAVIDGVSAIIRRCFLSDEALLGFDAIVTNPPFSIKQKFLARCYELGRPFALLMPLTTFDSKERQRMFHDRGVEVIFMPKRVNFETPSGKGSSAWFATAWFTWGLDLPSQLVFSGFQEQLQLDASA